MDVEGIKKVAVVGAGLMGHGIAQEYALGGYEVRLNDLTDDILAKSLSNIRANLEMLQRMDLTTEDQAAHVLERVYADTSLENTLDGVDIVVEVIDEDLEEKRRMFALFDELAPRHAILASNTSSFMPSWLASATERPEQVLVTHYINPPFLIPLVEVIPSPQTTDQTLDTVVALLSKLEKRPVVLGKEAPGFVVNRLQLALLREAVYIVEQGIASPADVDLVVSGSFGRRWAVAGPFQVLDIAGWDVITSIYSQLAPEINSSKELPALLREMVARGDYGIKTGRGFYEWTPESVSAIRRKIGEFLITAERLSKEP